MWSKYQLRLIPIDSISNILTIDYIRAPKLHKKIDFNGFLEDFIKDKLREEELNQCT